MSNRSGNHNHQRSSSLGSGGAISGRNGVTPSIPKPINLPSMKRESQRSGEHNNFNRTINVASTTSSNGSNGNGHGNQSSNQNGENASLNGESSASAAASKWAAFGGANSSNSVKKSIGESGKVFHNNGTETGKGKNDISETKDVHINNTNTPSQNHQNEHLTSPSSSSTFSTSFPNQKYLETHKKQSGGGWSVPVDGGKEWVDDEDTMDFSAKPVFLDDGNGGNGANSQIISGINGNPFGTSNSNNRATLSKLPSNSPSTIVAAEPKSNEISRKLQSTNLSEPNDQNLTTTSANSNYNQEPVMIWQPMEETLRDKTSQRNRNIAPVKILKRRDPSIQSSPLQHQNQKQNQQASTTKEEKLSDNRNKRDVTKECENAPSNSSRPPSFNNFSNQSINQQNQNVGALNQGYPNTHQSQAFNTPQFQSPSFSASSHTSKMRDFVISIPGTRTKTNPITVKIKFEIPHATTAVPHSSSATAIPHSSSPAAAAAASLAPKSQPHLTPFKGMGGLIRPGGSFASTPQSNNCPNSFMGSNNSPARIAINFDKFIVKFPSKLKK